MNAGISITPKYLDLIKASNLINDDERKKCESNKNKRNFTFNQ